jgi:hypothetical protein
MTSEELPGVAETFGWVVVEDQGERHTEQMGGTRPDTHMERMGATSSREAMRMPISQMQAVRSSAQVGSPLALPWPKTWRQSNHHGDWDHKHLSSLSPALGSQGSSERKLYFSSSRELKSIAGFWYVSCPPWRWYSSTMTFYDP